MKKGRTYQKILRFYVPMTHSNTAMNVRQCPKDLQVPELYYHQEIIQTEKNNQWDVFLV